MVYLDYTYHISFDPTKLPNMDDIILTGLDFSMKPEKARFEASKKFIRPFPELKVKTIIKSLAIKVYTQEKLTNLYHSNVCDDRNALAWFLCSVHRQSAPQPKKHRRNDSNSSNQSNSSSKSGGSCKSVSRNGKKNCELPTLVTTSMLPLGYWEGLYYALLAEIQQLHADLQERFGFTCDTGTEPLHRNGPDGNTKQPIYPVHLASMLESAWFELTDHRLVATLDDAVRMKNMRQQAAQQQDDNNALPQVIYGMIDINALKLETIIHFLWEKYAPEVDSACLEDFEDESMVSAYRAEILAKQADEALAFSTLLNSAAPCTCHSLCACKLKCDYEAGHCPCSDVQVVKQCEEEDDTGIIKIKFVQEDKNKAVVKLPATTRVPTETNRMAAASPDASVTQAPAKMSEPTKTDDRYSTSKTRKRTNTNTSELAYVPDPAASLRGTKDAYPLDFYGRNSGHRYPKLPSQSATPSYDTPSIDCDSYFTYDLKVPSRKPVPSPVQLAGSSRSSGGGNNQATKHSYSTVPVTPTFPQAPISYPRIPVSQSKHMFSQSFPANDYVGLLSEHPSAIDYPEQYNAINEAFPTLTPAVTSSPPKEPKASKAKHTKNNSSGSADLKSTRVPSQGFLTLKAIDKAHPALSAPDFIAPKPAAKQRYVSAGGNIPLSERAEIEPPAYTTSPTSTGRGITKEELEAKMGDPEWVKKNFGEGALGAVGVAAAGVFETMSPPRRPSDESGRGTPGDGRDRTSSGASKRDKFKRIFSRKNSQSEAFL